MFLNMRLCSGALAMVVLMVAMPLSCFIGRSEAMIQGVPKEIDGWREDPQIDTYDGNTLFKYIDGGAELYLAYRFLKVKVHKYSKPGQPEIIMDIYEMTTAEDAFGVFTAEREGADMGIGQGSEYDAGLLRFFKGRFFISIMTYGETPQSKKAVLSLGREVAIGIQSTGDKPELVSSLPQKGLIENSILFFYNHIILNHHYFVANENILQINEQTQGVLARYAVTDEKVYLLVVQYPTTDHAKSAYTSFLNAYMPDAVPKDTVQTENGKWTVTALFNQRLVVVFDTPNQRSARSLLRAVGIQLGVKP